MIINNDREPLTALAVEMSDTYDFTSVRHVLAFLGATEAAPIHS